MHASCIIFLTANDMKEVELHKTVENIMSIVFFFLYSLFDKIQLKELNKKNLVL